MGLQAKIAGQWVGRSWQWRGRFLIYNLPRIRARVASLMAPLLLCTSQVDALVFTGGLGEKSHLLRTLLCEDLAGMGPSTWPPLCVPPRGPRSALHVAPAL